MYTLGLSLNTGYDNVVKTKLIIYLIINGELVKLTNTFWGQHINKNRTQLTIEAVPMPKEPLKTDVTKTEKKERIMPPISLSLIPVTGPKENSPIKTLNFEQGSWNEEVEEYNALDKMKDFAEKAAFDLPKRKGKLDFSLKPPEHQKGNNMEKLIDSYSRISEFINGCDWSKSPEKTDTKSLEKDPKSLEKKYLDAKNEFMSQNLMLMPKKVYTDPKCDFKPKPKGTLKEALEEVIDLSEGEENDDNITEVIRRKLLKGLLNVGKDGALSISVQQSKEYGSVRSRFENKLN